MSREEKIAWMALWCTRQEVGVSLALEGECGFGRECVGILVNDSYPEYEWYDDKTYERLDENGDVWTPEDAYDKHACVAVLGRGEEAESQLYEWLRWFEDNKFIVESGVYDNPPVDPVSIMLGKHMYQRMVRQ